MATSSASSVVAYGIGVLGGGFGLVQLLLRVRADKALLALKQKLDSAEALRERRFTVYSEYLKKLDAINEGLTGAFSGDALQGELSKLLATQAQGSNFVEAQRNYFALISKLTAEWGNARTKAIEELSGLRLVSNPSILARLDRYVELTNALVACIGDLMNRIGADPSALQDLTLGDRVKQIHGELKITVGEIETQMRIDIGAESVS